MGKIADLLYNQVTPGNDFGSKMTPGSMGHFKELGVSDAVISSIKQLPNYDKEEDRLLSESEFAAKTKKSGGGDNPSIFTTNQGKIALGV